MTHFSPLVPFSMILGVFVFLAALVNGEGLGEPYWAHWGADGSNTGRSPRGIVEGGEEFRVVFRVPVTTETSKYAHVLGSNVVVDSTNRGMVAFSDLHCQDKTCHYRSNLREFDGSTGHALTDVIAMIPEQGSFVKGEGGNEMEVIGLSVLGNSSRILASNPSMFGDYVAAFDLADGKATKVWTLGGNSVADCIANGSYTALGVPSALLCPSHGQVLNFDGSVQATLQNGGGSTSVLLSLGGGEFLGAPYATRDDDGQVSVEIYASDGSLVNTAQFPDVTALEKVIVDATANTLYLVGQGVVAVNATSLQTLWYRPIVVSGKHSVAQQKGGDLVALTLHGTNLVSLDSATGNVDWVFPLNDEYNCNGYMVAVDASDRVFVSCDTSILAFASNGSLLSSIVLPPPANATSSITVPLALSKTALLAYVGSDIYGLDLKGTQPSPSIPPESHDDDHIDNDHHHDDDLWPNPHPSKSPTPNKHPLSPGAVAGIAIGALATVALGGFVFWRFRSQHQHQEHIDQYDSLYDDDEI